MNKKKEKFRLHNHLFIQLWVSFGAILICFALSIGVIFTNLYEDDIIKTYKKQLKKQARHISKEMTEYVCMEDAEGCFSYQDYLNSISNSENTDIWLIDNPDDEIELQREFTNADIVDIQLSDEVKRVLRRAKKGKVAFAVGYDAIYGKTMMSASAPIYDAKERIVGIVLLNSFVEQRDALISGSREYIVYSIVAGIIIALILSTLLATIITKPLTRMRQAVGELTAGNYQERTHVKGKNEIAILAHGMDTLAERLEQNDIERREAEQLRLDFFANVSHELRTPITVMRGYSESLADGVLSSEEKKQQYYQRMVTECQRMERLVGDLLTLSKVQNPHFVIEKEPINLVQVFHDISRSYKSVMEEKHLNFQFSSQEDLIFMLGDYDRLRQLFLNIIDNAIKFSQEGGNIWVTIKKTERIEVSIRDEGIGIAKEELSNIFDKFYKSKLRQNAKGSGLGLVIAKYIVEKHEGIVEVKSEEGVGTEFLFYFQEYTGDWEQ